MTLEAALAQHRSGHLAEAERLYHAYLAVEPRNAEALHLLGYVALQTGRWQAAVDWISRSLEVNPTQIAARLNLGVALRNHRQFSAALQCFDHVLASDPSHLEALNNRADVLIELYRPREALESLEKALHLQPNFPEALNNRGRALNALGETRVALEVFDLALQLKPSFTRALNNRGNVLRKLNRLEDALANFDQAVRLDPHSSVALYNRANALLELERYEEALQCYEELLRRDPQDAETLTNRGVALLHLHQAEKSVAAHRQALLIQPNFPRALNNLGNSLRKLHRLDEALVCYDQALRWDPVDPDALSNRGVVLTELHRYDEAVASHDLALEKTRDKADLFYNRGNTRLALRQMQAALQDFEQALLIRPNAPDALFNVGFALTQLNRHDAAAASFDRLLQIEPGYPLALGMRFHCLAMVGDWSEDLLRDKIIAAVSRGELVDDPFCFMSVSGSAEDQLRCAQNYMSDRYPGEHPASAPRSKRSDDRIRLAYLSGDFRDHPVSRLLVGVFEQHDRTHFETIGIALRAADQSDLGKRVAAAFDQFVDVSARSDAEVISLMRGMNVDIAIDLMGCTQGQRTRIFAQRAAPVQVNFIGYPGTLGTEYLDYLIADRFVVPQDRQPSYAESIVYLPECYQPNDDRRALAQANSTRSRHGLPEQGIVWCCFNNTYKINEAMFNVWMSLLRQTPDSVLWLYVDSAAAERNMRREAEQRGVAPSRLVMAPRVAYDEHLARLPLADVYLDTTPFSGGATASDVLWAGVPLLAYAGDAFAARMSGSLLQALGLPELITTDLQSYEKAALELAGSPEWRLQLREKLRLRRFEAPLFNTKRYCRHLEAAYMKMHERVLRGHAPANITVESEQG
jgi:predicted O-linked N-acetylglucosamine transferase (SPINDLY family)